MCAVAWPNAFDSGPRMLKLTTSAPPLRSSRREKRVVSIGFSLCPRLNGFRRALDRANHPEMAAAAAEDRIECALDVGVGGIRVLVEQHLRGHEDAVHAVAALR